MIQKRIYFYTFLFLLVFLGYLTYKIITPFLVPLGWAIIFSIFFYPLYAFILKGVKVKHVASLLTIIIIIFLLFGPISYLSVILIKELKEVVIFSDTKTLSLFDQLKESILYKRAVEYISNLLKIDSSLIDRKVTEFLLSIPREFFGFFKQKVTDIMTGFLNLFFMFLALFFFLEEGPQFIMRLIDYLPLGETERKRIMEKTHEIIFTTIYGQILIALSQALIAGFAFFFVGIPHPAFFGVTTFISSFIPLFGTFLVWGPLCFYLFLKVSFIKGLILAIVGVFGISFIDNILRPIILKGKLGIPTILIFFVVLGGIKFFGFIGLFLGPLVVSLFLIILEIIKIEKE